MTTERDWLLISETFTTLQGEGPSTGKRAHFVRLGPCDLECRWCDTAYTWAFSERKAERHESGKQYDVAAELKRRSISSLATEVKVAKVPLLVITGGEPLIQLPTVSRFISEVNDLLEDRSPRVEIETAGHHSPGELSLYPRVYFNVSPKLASSGNGRSKRFNPVALKEFVATGRAIFKFVVETRTHRNAPYKDDIAEITQIIGLCGIPAEQVWLMPCATTESQVTSGLQLLAPIAMEHRWNLTGRMHISIWASERGH